MRRFNLFLTLAATLMAFLLTSTVYAQDSTMVQKKNQFRKQMNQNKAQAKSQKGVRGFVDENGDGYNDNAPDADGDGIPNGQDPDFVRPQDGSRRKAGQGQGKGMKGSGSGTGLGTGDCDGTGSKGKGGKRGN